MASVEHTVRLRGGRVVGYAQYGAAQGFPVLNAHGGLLCRWDVAAADLLARAAGIRLISPDRPGVGRSDPQPGRTVVDWASGAAPALYGRLAARQLGPADATVLRENGFSAFGRMSHEAPPPAGGGGRGIPCVDAAVGLRTPKTCAYRWTCGQAARTGSSTRPGRSS